VKLKKNLFGHRQAGRVWNKHLIEKLKQGIDVLLSWLTALVWGILKGEVVGSNPAKKLKT
jgi:hypothetical protein